MGNTPLEVIEKEADLGVVVSGGNNICWEDHSYKRNDWESKPKGLCNNTPQPREMETESTIMDIEDCQR